jgi:hypothetical protein
MKRRWVLIDVAALVVWCVLAYVVHHQVVDYSVLDLAAHRDEVTRWYANGYVGGLTDGVLGMAVIRRLGMLINTAVRRAPTPVDTADSDVLAVRGLPGAVIS